MLLYPCLILVVSPATFLGMNRSSTKLLSLGHLVVSVVYLVIQAPIVNKDNIGANGYAQQFISKTFFV